MILSSMILSFLYLCNPWLIKSLVAARLLFVQRVSAVSLPSDFGYGLDRSH
jgi:hypothetical protein